MKIVAHMPLVVRYYAVIPIVNAGLGNVLEERLAGLNMFCVKHPENCGAWKAVARRCNVAVILVACLLAACISRPQESEAIRTQIPQEAVDPDYVPELPGDTPVVSNDNKHTILALSAGGADGAYGAGVLAGWTAKGTRPSFDVVTGVSTGALLAVMAFLGPEYDELTRQLYTTQTNASIFRSRGIGGLFGDSLYDNAPFKAQIERYITKQVIDKVASEHDKGRRLYIATTNLDAGELVIWDMGRIAKGGRSNPLQHFQKVLRASASVPGFFKPVYIKPQRGVQLRQAHVDGGVKEPILFADFMGASALPEKHLYMIINGTTRRYNASTPVEANLASIAQKTIAELMRELQRDKIYRHYTVARNSGIDFRLTSIPDSIPISQESLDFDIVRMRQLYDAGFAAGQRGPDQWPDRPPTSRLPSRASAVSSLQQ
ncbi:MAG: patatin-like phospholipase family protein [Pseudomonadota bacterium]